MPSREQIRWAEMRVAVMCVTALVILSVLFYLLSGGTLLETKTTLRLYVEDSQALERGMLVRLNGIRIGKVQRVRLTGSREPLRAVEITLSVEKRFLDYLKEDSIAEVSAENLLGDKLIDITQGKSARTIQPNGEIRFQPAMSERDRANLMASIRTSIAGIDAVIRDIQQGKGAIGSFVKGEELFNSANARLIEIQKMIRANTAKDTQIGNLVYTDNLYRELADPLRKLDRSLEEMQAGATGPGKFLSDPEQYDKLQAQLADMRASLEKLESGEGAGGRFLRDEAAYRQWVKAVDTMIVTVDTFSYGESGVARLLSDDSLYHRLYGSTREFAEFTRDFRENPKKFLRVNAGIF